MQTEAELERNGKTGRNKPKEWEPGVGIRVVMSVALALFFALVAGQVEASGHIKITALLNRRGPLCDGSATAVTKGDITFLHALQAALKSHNYKWLAEHVDFPLKLALPSHKSLVVSNKASLKEHFDDIFPPANVKNVLALQKNGLGRTIQGVGLGKTGVYCLPVPKLGVSIPELNYFIYRVKWSAAPESPVEPMYAICWTDKVFFIQVKQALRNHQAQWLAAHIAMPFQVNKTISKRKNYTPSRRWFVENFDRIWRTPISKNLPKDKQSENRLLGLKRSVSECLLSFATTDLWQNWEGTMAYYGMLWFEYDKGLGGNCSNYWIISIAPGGTQYGPIMGS